METTITNKQQALNSLGVFDRKAIAKLSGRSEFIRVAPGRTLVTEGRYLPTSLVVVTGAIVVSTGSNDAVAFGAPCALDTWASDERRIALITATATEPTSLLAIDWKFRDAVFEAVDRLDTISSKTCRAVFTPATTRPETRIEANVS